MKTSTKVWRGVVFGLPLAGVVSLGVGLAHYLPVPSAAALVRLEDQRAELRAAVAELELATQRAGDSHVDLAAELPSELGIGAVLEFLSRAAERNGIEHITFDSGKDRRRQRAEQASRLASVPCTVTLQAEFGRLTRFLAEIESAAPRMRVDILRVEPVREADSHDVQATVGLRAFKLGPPAVPAEPQR